MQIEIREIRPEDYATVVSIWNSEIGGHIELDRFTRVTDKMNGDDNYRTFVAVLDGEVVGFITTAQILAINYDVGYLKINGMAVRRDLQGKGIGTQLMKHVDAFAARRNLPHLLLCSGFKRKAAHAFYEHYGFENGSYCFTKHSQAPTLRTVNRFGT